IVKQTQAAEKKTGEKLSPDRKNNAKGYASSNTRMVPEKLNRGRHHVDPKKLRAWKKRLKKHDLSTEEFYTLMKSKAADSEFLSELLKNMEPEVLEQYIELFDIDDGCDDPKSDCLTKAIPSIKDAAGAYDIAEKGPEFKGYT